MTLRRRIVLAASAAVALAVAVASVVVYTTTRAELRGQVDDALRGLVPDVRLLGDGERLFTIKVQRSGEDRAVTPVDPLGGPTGIAQIVTGDGEVVPAIGGVRIGRDARALEVARGERAPYFRDATVDGTHVRVYTARGIAGDAIQVARPLTEVDASLSRLRVVLLLVTLGGVGLAGGLGLWVSRTALAPVQRLTETAEHVAATQDLSRRLPAGADDELGRLGSSFNTMLGA
ncbi:MAG: HAMP domain-containing protein, partial [Solirubrobacterales bacterium]|nr:HAMP domain-containing protein [Solirubrobacterales bacterium]